MYIYIFMYIFSLSSVLYEGVQLDVYHLLGQALFGHDS